MKSRTKWLGLFLSGALLWNTIPLGGGGEIHSHSHSAESNQITAVTEVTEPWLFAATGTFSGGSGTSTDPYLIATVQDLKKVSAYSSSYFRQICDISLVGTTFSPISYFYGNYDGGGFAIRNLTVSGSYTCAGLVGTNYGKIENLRLEDCKINVYSSYGTLFCGSIVGRNYSGGKIINCSVSGSVIGDCYADNYDSYVGGIVGMNQGLVQNCKNTAQVTADSDGIGVDNFAGGIVGSNNSDSVLKNCYNTGSVQVPSGRNCIVGGIAGNNYGQVTAVKNTGAISANSTVEYDGYNSDAFVGGAVGYNLSTVSYAENYGNISAKSSVDLAEAGGIVGYSGDGVNDVGPFVVEYSKNFGDVTAHSTGGESRAGGIAATSYMNSYVRYCCNMGNVSATENKQYNLSMAGGLVGSLMYATMLQSCNHGDVTVSATQYDTQVCGLATTTEAVIVDCYNTGNVYVNSKPIRYSNGRGAMLFIDSDTTCINSYSTGSISKLYSSNECYGLYGDSGGRDRNSVQNCFTTVSQGTNASQYMTSAEAKLQSTYTGYDFEVIWAIDPAINGGHPYLRNIPDDTASGWYADLDEIVAVTGVKVSPTSLRLTLGQSAQLTATVLPENARNKNVEWYTYSSNYIQVSANGKVTAVGAGSGFVYVRTEDGQYTANCIVTVTAQTPTFSGGSGTVSDPYLIATPSDLQNVKYALSANYRLIADIDMAGESFLPIGNENTPFRGSFDGNGYKIKNLTVDLDDRQYAGLFGYSSGTIRNVKMENVTVIAYSASESIYGGGVVGYNAGTLSDCFVKGNISVTTQWEEQHAYAGGVAGYSSKSISNSIFNGKVHSKVSYIDANAYSGGIAGYGNGANNCQNYGAINAAAAVSSNAYAGGIMGYSGGAIESCYNIGEIRAENSRCSYAGGIVGWNASTVISTKNLGKVYSSTAFNDYNASLYALAGGISGNSFGRIAFGENEGEIIAASTSSHAYAGGVVGYNNAGYILENSKNSGRVTAGSTGGESRAGGIASSSYRNSIVRYCCNNGEVSITDNPYYWSGTAGGVIVVLQYGTMQECCNHGRVIIDSKNYEPEGGAIIAHGSDAIMNNCYSDANVHSNFRRNESYNNGVIAGIGGGNGTIFTNCYFSGTLTSTYSYTEKQGLVKQWGGSEHTITNCYTINLYSGTQSGSRMTDAQSRQQSTYKTYDFFTIWAIDPNLNDGRPYLRRIPAENDSRWYSGPEVLIKVNGVTMDQSELYVHIGESGKLNATVSPDDANYKLVVWSSDNTSVVTVDQSGNLVAVGAGMANVIVTTKEGGYTARCLVVVSDHEYQTQVIPPDCWSDGFTIYSCIYCEDEYLDDWVPTTGHIMGSWEITCEPTCYNYGEQMQRCQNCEYYEIEEIEPYWHYDMRYYSGKEPTCTEYGWWEYYVCALCGESSYYELPPLGHDLIHHEGKAPTATESGWKEYDTCTRCDYTTYTELPATGVESVKGDINGDGAVTSVDLDTLRAYLVGIEVAVIAENLDPNGDGVTNMRDVAILAQYLAGLDVKLQ